MPIIVRIALSLAIIGLGAGILYIVAGGLKTVAGGVGTTLTGFVDDVTATPSPSPSIAVVSGAPSLESADEPYTSSPQVDLVVTVPASMVGDPTHRIRVYLALLNQKPSPLMEVPIGPTAKTASRSSSPRASTTSPCRSSGDGGESEPSAVVRYVLDNSQAEGDDHLAEGQRGRQRQERRPSRARRRAARRCIARNETNGATSAGTAETDGTFTLSIPIATGQNTIDIDGDRPGRQRQHDASLTVRRGNGKLTASLSASALPGSRKALPEAIRLTVTVDRPRRQPAQGRGRDVHPQHPGHPHRHPGR